MKRLGGCDGEEEDDACGEDEEEAEGGLELEEELLLLE